MVVRQPRRKNTESDDWSEFNGVQMPVEEFVALDDAEESDLEYYDGATWEKGVVDANHGDIVGRLAWHFENHRLAHGGRFGPERRVRLAPRVYRKPDLAYYAPGTASGNDELPTLAIEVRSPDETMAHQRRKCRMFREHGVLVCWLIDPISRTVEVFEGDRDSERLPADGVLSTEHLPGFELPVAELFAALDR